jgi:hypothetical protein
MPYARPLPLAPAIVLYFHLKPGGLPLGMMDNHCSVIAHRLFLLSLLLPLYTLALHIQAFVRQSPLCRVCPFTYTLCLALVDVL